MNGHTSFLFSATNSLLRRSFDEGVAITPIKLQKLLYFLHKRYLQENRVALFTDEFLAWDYGPVQAKVYDAFRSYGGTPITSYFEENKQAFAVRYEDYDFYDALDFVWQHYVRLRPFELVEITHMSGGAWERAYLNNSPTISNDDIFEEEWRFE